MRRMKRFFSRSPWRGMTSGICLLWLQACGVSERIAQVDMLGSYLYVDELNMAPGSANQVHLACKRANGKPLAGLAVQVEVSKAGADLDFLAPQWLESNKQGEQGFPFTFNEPGMYTLALQLKYPGSKQVFAPEAAYTIVQVLDEQAVGALSQENAAQTQNTKPLQVIARGTALNTQVLLRHEDGKLQHQARAIRFQSSDPLAILPGPIVLTGEEGSNKIILKGTQLYTFGEQSLFAIEEGVNRIVSEQRYMITPGPKTAYRVLLEKPQVPTIADGQSLAQVQLTLTDGDGTPMKQMRVVLAIGQGSAIVSLPAVTDDAGMATFAWAESIAGEKFVEVFLQVPSGMLPIHQDSIVFVSGPPARLRFVASPAFGRAGEVLSPVPAVEVVDALGNLVALDATAVALTLIARLPLASDSNRLSAPFSGDTIVWLEEGRAVFDNVAILLASDSMQLVASSPGLVAGQSAAFAMQPQAATRLAFVSQPASGLVYGRDNPVQIALQDMYGNLVPKNGTPISLSLTGAVVNGHQLIGTILATTRDGMANLGAGLNRSGSGFAIIASSPGLLLATSQAFDVATGAPDGLFSQITLTSNGAIVANEVDHHTLEIQLRDAQSAPILGFPVGITVPLGQVQVAYPFGRTTDSNGIIRIELRSTLAGEKTILVEMGAINRQVIPKPAFLPGSPAQANLSLNQSTLILDGVKSLSVTGRLEDIHGNALPNAPYTLSSTSLTDTILPSSGTTDSQGRLSASWQGTLASASPRELRLQSGSYFSAPAQALFIPGSPSALHSTLVASPSTAIADGQSTVVLQARIADAFNNPIPTMQILFSASGKENLLPDALVYTDTLGIAQANLRSLASQDKQIQITLGLFTLQATATFLPPPCIGTPILSLEQSNQSLDTGNLPEDVVSADFNQDTIVDLAVVNSGSNTLSIFFGLANGTFAPQVNYLTERQPRAITSLDVNRDGRMDLAVVNWQSNTLGTFLARSDGTFMPQITYPTEIRPIALTSLDANRDGIADIAVVNYGSDTFSIFFGRADGTFASQITYETGSLPTALTTLDANRDGIMDIALVNSNSKTLSIFLGLPDGTFVSQTTYQTATYPLALTSLDINQDGLMDLAVVNYSSEALGIYYGLPDGTFTSQTNYNTLRNPRSMTKLDANQDGRVDLAVVNSSSNTLSIFLGQANGAFAPQRIYETGSLPVAVTSLDTNRDGLVDLAVVNSNSATLGILLGLKDGTFFSSNIYGTGNLPVALTSLDTNRDGLIDLATVNWGNNTLDIFLGREDGTFAPQITYHTGIQPTDLTSLDANRDGRIDLAVVNSSSNTLGILLGLSDGTFAAQRSYTTGSKPTALTTLDANRDDLVDLAVVNYSSHTLGVFLALADGTFAPQSTYTTGVQPIDLTSLDTNQDGLMDLAVVNYSSNTLGILLGLPDGTFAPQTTYGTGSGPKAITTLDANLDGIIDIAVVNYVNNTLSLFLGQASGTFVAQSSYTSSRSPSGLKVLDINQDNLQDILTYGNNSSLHIGLTGGSFAPAIIYDQPGKDVVVDDFDQDYVPDFIMISGDRLKFINRQYCGH